MNTITTHRRLTAGPPGDNLPAIVDAIHGDVMLAFSRSEHHAAPLDARTALAILLRQALDELASYWPAPAPRDAEFDTALFDLRYALLPQLRSDAKQIEVLRMATQRIEQHAADLEQLQAAVEQEVADLRRELATARAQAEDAQLGPRYDRSLVYHGEDEAGNPILAIAPDNEPVGSAMATAEPEAKAHNWDFLSPVWRTAPPDVRNIVMALETKATTWRQLDTATRRQITQHVLNQLSSKKKNDYDQLKPTWMPTENGLVTTLNIPWSKLVALDSPWP